MSLKDLNELALIAKSKNDSYLNKEVELNDLFKNEFKHQLEFNSADKIQYSKYTSQITTPKGLIIIFPNQWFYIASFFTEFIQELKKYKEEVNLLGLSSPEIKQMKENRVVSDDANAFITNNISDRNDVSFMVSFLSDYSWWFGSKTIDRGDYFVSPVLKLANVVNESTTYISTLAWHFSNNDRLVELLNVESEFKGSQGILQKIFYGAPGTGKSHRIEEILKGIPEEQKERVTFHPEYDYPSFVGGYRPYSEKKEEGYDVMYKFVPQVFTNMYVKAWQNPKKEYYLVIEEINRGNCAEIFGDLFQLLDRNSKYNISPSKDLLDYLQENLKDEEAEGGIKEGKMKLPINLHILASMNTSDQSLFPMDSAFKRRWEWEYIPINIYPIDERGVKNKSYDFIVKLDNDYYFRWIDFISKVNILIRRNPNLGTDKCIGNYFIKPENNIISLEEFVNKVIFYLWIDVFKDEEDSIFELRKHKITLTYEDFFPISSKGKEYLVKLLEEENVALTIYKETEEVKEE